MKHLVRNAFILLISYCSATVATSLSDESLALKQAYEELQLKQRDPARQANFLKRFPDSAGEFNRMFNSPSQGELWDGSRYIFELERLSQTQPKETFALLLKLAGELQWAKDAPNYLQFVLMKLSIDNPFEFATQYESLNNRQKKGIAKFLTSGKNGPATGFRQFTNILRRINKSTIADELERG